MATRVVTIGQYLASKRCCFIAGGPWQMHRRELAKSTQILNLAMWSMAAALLLIATGCNGRLAASSSSDEARASEDDDGVAVHVQRVERRRIAGTISALGKCEALPNKLAMVTPAVEGQVSSLLVEQGRRVGADQPIVQLDDSLARADLAEKQRTRESLVASLQLLKSTPRREEQQAHKLAIEQADIAAAQAEAIVNRMRPLRQRGEVSEQQLYDAEQALEQARVQQRLAQAQFDVVMLGPRDEAVAEAQSRIAVADEAVTAAEARLALYTIRAHISGVLDSLTCRLGETLAIGTSIGEVIDNQSVLVKAWLPIGNSRLVKSGQSARVHSAGSRPSDSKRDDAATIEGQVVYVGGVADLQTGNVAVDIAVDNSQGRFVVGETLNVEIVVNEPEEGWAVPVAAMHDEGEGNVITVVRDGKAVILNPQFGQSENGWVAVTDVDLAVDDLVIVNGAYNLPNGATVEVNTDETSPAESHAEGASDSPGRG